MVAWTPKYNLPVEEPGDPSRRMMATSPMHAEWVDLNAILDALVGDSE